MIGLIKSCANFINMVMSLIRRKSVELREFPFMIWLKACLLRQESKSLCSSLPPYALNGQGRQEAGGRICIPAYRMINFLLDKSIFYEAFEFQSTKGKGALCPNLNVFGFLLCRYAYAQQVDK